MAYRIRQDEPIGKGLDRILKKESLSAVDRFAQACTSDEAVHESRKSIKKARAILLLVPKDARDKAESDIQLLRGVGHLLAPLRDVDAMVRTVGDLCARYAGAHQKETCAAARRTLEQHKREIEAEGRREVITATAAQALMLVGGAKRWQLKRTGFSTMVRTLKWDYERAQRAMVRAKSSFGDADFHRWRRRVKTLWYHLRLLELRATTATRRADELGQLEDRLGQDHNLVVLRAKLATGPGVHENKSAASLITELSARRQQELRREALALGARILAGRPKDAFRHLQEIWQPRITNRSVSDVRVADLGGDAPERLAAAGR